MEKKAGSTWSIKYGELEQTGRSGLTPIKAFFVNGRLRNNNGIVPLEDLLSDEYQRDNLQGFTTQELIDLGAITTNSMKPGDLINPIIPFFEKDNWDDGACYSIPFNSSRGSGAGFWRADNPAVWAILKPILVLASRMLQSSILTPFFSALLHCRRDPVPIERIPADILFFGTGNLSHPSAAQLKTIRPGHAYPSTVETIAEEQRLLFLDMKKRLTLCFKQAEVHPVTGKEISDGDPFYLPRAWAYTAADRIGPEGKGGPIWIFMDYKDFESLLRPDMTDCDRLGLQWSIASTLVHEAYFEDEPMAELGYAMEKNALGGIRDVLNPHYEPLRTEWILPLVCFFETQWPGVRHLGRPNSFAPILLSPPLHRESNAYPIPAELYEDAQQEEFWQVRSRSFGAGTLAQRSLRIGMSTTFLSSTDDDTIIQQQLTASQNFASSTLLKLGILACQTPQGRKAFAFGRRLYENARVYRFDASSPSIQKEEIDEILCQIPFLQDPQNIITVEDRNKLIQDFIPMQLIYLTMAAKTHRKMTEAPELNNEPQHYTTWRHSQLAFNRGIKRFSRQLRDLLNAVNYENLVFQMVEIDRDLEVAWMNLYFEPENHDIGTPEDQNEYLEYRRLDIAYCATTKRDLAAQQAIKTLRAYPGVSSIFLAIIQIIEGSGLFQERPMAQRFDDLEAGINALETLSYSASKTNTIPPWWENNLKGWIDHGWDLRRGAREEQRNAAPSASQIAGSSSHDVEMTG